jgi:serine/threonine protein kinase
LSEARATARLNHSNIVAGIDVGVAEGQYYFVMEYIDGPSLHKKLERGGAFDEKMSLSIILQIAKALEHAAKHQMVHRDIKPDNIMITKSGIAKLCDLGLALHSTQTNFEEGGRALGTPYYISPEQALGKGEVDIRSDLYSLGATLFHLLTGKPPFQGSPAVVMTKHINEKAPSLLEKLPSLKKETALLVQKLLEKNPKDRYQTPKELIEDLEKILESRNMVLTKASSPPISQTPKLKEVSRTQKVNAPKATLPEKATEETPPPRSKANALRAMRKRRSRF